MPTQPEDNPKQLCRAKAGGPQPAEQEGALLAPEPTPATEQHSLEITPVIIVPSDSSWAGVSLA